MNKAALIEQMAKDTKLSKTACKGALESFVKAVESALKKNKSVVKNSSKGVESGYCCPSLWTFIMN